MHKAIVTIHPQVVHQPSGIKRFWFGVRLPRCPAHGHTSNVTGPTKNPIVIVADDVKKIQTTKKTPGSDMVAKGMMKVHAAH